MGHRLLVVDNDRRFLQDHRASLESAFDVDFREGTEGSLTHLEAGSYAAILLCVEASENKGYALCSAIRRSPVLGDLKVALISAKATEEEYARHQSLKGKADLYLHKPIRPSALVTALTPLVPLKAVDPDNPLGDLGGPDLGDEWLESLRSELEVETAPRPQPPAPHPHPIPVATLLGFTRPLGPLPPQSLPVPKAPPVPRDSGRVELLEARVKDVETKLVATSDELDRANHDLEELRRNATSFQTLFEEKHLLAMELETRLAAAEAAAEQAARDLEQMSQQEMEARDRLAEKSQVTMDMMESNQLLQAQLAETREDAERLVRAKDALEARCGELESRTGIMASHAGELSSRIAGQEARVGELEASLAEREARIGEQETRIGEQQARIGELEARNGGLDARIGEQQSRFGELEAERDELRGALELSRGAEAELRAQMAAQEQDHERQQMELLAAVDDRDSRLVRSEEAMNGLRERITALEEAQAGAETRLQARSARLAEVVGRLAELESQVHQALEFSKTEMV